MSSKRKFEESEEAVLEEMNEQASQQVNDEPVKKKKKKKKRASFNDEDDNTMDLTQNEDVEPKEAETGIVERVFVQNFICHKKLEVRLGSNVNFIIGLNGSGKSAILTALIVGLGGKAAMTDRGSSLKAFIKDGCHSSTVEITLRNRNTHTDAYKHHEYGDSIIVERKISSEGTGSYKIKNKEGKVVSTKKDELVNILDHFNIQIDNPVSILTQNTSRSFLNTSNPKHKYAFFLKATQLERLTDDYQKIYEEKELTKILLERKQQVIPELKHEMQIHEEKYNDMQQLQKMKKQIIELKQELSWAHVNESKKAVADADKAHRRYESKLPSYKDAFQNAQDLVEELSKSYSEKREELLTFRDNVSAVLSEKDDLTMKHKKMKDGLKKCQNDIRKIDSDIHRAEKDRKHLYDAVEEIKNTVQKDFEAERKAREQALEEKQNLKKQYENQLSNTSNYCQQIDANLHDKQRRKNEFQNAIRDKDKDIERKRRQLVEIENQKKNKLNVFGEYTSNVLKAIEEYHKQGRFHRKPVGPLGSLITLKDRKWGLAIEECIGGNMRSYVCHDSHDMNLLRDIFKRTIGNASRGRGSYGGRAQQPSIILSSFTDAYDISRSRPGRGFLTVLDSLQIDNVVASNTLIDQASIETVLLIENAKEAEDIMFSEQTRPRNSTKAFSMKGHTIIGGRFSKTYAPKNKRVKFFVHDAAGSIREIENEMRHLQEEKKATTMSIRQLEGEIQQDRQEKNRTQKKRLDEQDKINQVKMEIQELQQMEELHAPDVDELERDLAEHVQRISILQENKARYTDVYNEKKDELKDHEAVIAQFHERRNQVSAELEELEGNHAGYEEKLREGKRKKRHYEDELDKLNEKIQQAERKLENEKKIFETKRDQALEYCVGEEIQTTRTPNKVDSEINVAQKRIEREESVRGNADEIVKKYYAARLRFDTSKQELANCKKNLKAIEKAMERRIARFKDFRRYISRRAQEYFGMLLSQRGYSGKLTLLHDAEELRIEVNVEQVKGSEVGDSKALSGGERSFSTICFIMALWEAMEAPFRCLDEFDVFMDMMNRQISMRMLLKIAKEQVSRQFILLTPQDMSKVACSDRVRLFRLSDPERGQQTIDFEAA
ncbi:structural maintenance of chromosomes protein 6-like [Clytia hemisphaerica]